MASRPVVILRALTARPGVSAYEGWDRTRRRRVVVHRHADDAAARREFAALERTAAACDPGLVAGAAFHRLCFDAEVDFGEFARIHAPETEHPSIVMQTHPGARGAMRLERRARGDAEIAAIVRPVLAAVAELHDRTGLVHLGVSPGNLARMWSGRCTLTDLHLATEAGRAVAPGAIGPGLFACPDTARTGVAHRGADMWSCGVLVYRLAHRSFMAHPFDDGPERPLWRGAPSAEEVVRKASHLEYTPDMWRNRTAPRAAALCAALLDPYIEARPSAREALRHDLFLAV